MVGEVLALFNAAAQAGSNVTAGAAVRRSSPVGVLLIATPITVLGALIAVAISGQTFSGSALWWGLAAGVMGGIGLLWSYRAFDLGRVAVVVPVTTCAATFVQVGAGWVLDGRPGTGTLVGAVACLGAVTLIARGQGDAAAGQRPVLAVVLGMAAGCCFAAFVILLSRAHDEASAWGLLAARVGVLGVILLLAVWSAAKLPLGSRSLTLSGFAGVLDVTANVLLLAALSVAALAVVSAVVAVAPVIAALLAIAFLGERLTPHQVAGIALATVGVWLVILT